MTPISKISRLVDGLPRNIDLTGNTLVVGALKVGASTLSEAILGRLISSQDGSELGASYHTHDSQYFTEAELSATTGSTLIGDDSSAYTYISPAGDTLRQALDAIDVAIGSAVGTDEKTKVSVTDTTQGFLDGKLTAGSGLSKSITSPGGDEKLDLAVNVDGSTIEISADALQVKDLGISTAKLADSSVTNAKLASNSVDASKIIDGSITNAEVSATADIAISKLKAPTSNKFILSDGSGNLVENSEDLASGTGGIVHATTSGQLSRSAVTNADLITALNGYNDVSGATVDSRLVELETATKSLWHNPVFTATIVDPPGSPSNGDRYLIGDGSATASGSWAGQEGNIAEWSDTLGDWKFEATYLGSAVSVNDNSSFIYLRISDMPGVMLEPRYFVFDGTSGAAISHSAGVLSVNVDDATIEVSGNNLQVKDLGISTAKLADSSVTEAKLASDSVTTAKIADSNVTNAKLATGIDAAKIAGGNVSNTEFDQLADISTAMTIQSQIDSKIDLTEKGAALGVATLDAGGKIPVSQLPSSVMEFKGAWDANTNSPSLADGTGNAGDVYRVSVAGSQDLGSGSQTFAIGDWVMYSGSIWQHSPATDAVTSVNTLTGAVTLHTDDISEDGSPTNLWFTNSRARAALSVLDTTSVNLTLSADAAASSAEFHNGSTEWNIVNGFIYTPFTPSSDISIDSVSLYLRKDGTDATTVSAEIVPDLAGSPDVASPIALDSVSVSSLNAGALTEAAFAVTGSPATLLGGQQYWIGFWAGTGSGNTGGVALAYITTDGDSKYNFDHSSTFFVQADRAMHVKLYIPAIEGGVISADLQAAVAGAGLRHTAGVLSIDEGNGIEVTADGVAVRLEGPSISRSASGIMVSDLGITTAKLAALSVTTAKIADSQITTDKLADDAVTTAKILDSNVTNAKLATGIDAAKIAGGNVSNTEFDQLADISTAMTIQSQIDGKVSKSGDTMAGPLAMGNNQITGLAAANGPGEAVRWEQNGIKIYALETAATAPVAGDIVVASQSEAFAIKLADSDALATCEGVLGVVVLVSGADYYVQYSGEVQVNKSVNFDLGKRVYVSGTTGGTPGEGTKTAPTATNSVVFLLGTAVQTNKVLLGMHLETVNEV